MTTNLIEMWLRLVSDALRGTADAQEAIRTLSEAPTTPDQMTRWLTRFMPSALGTYQPHMFEEWLEQTWRVMGVVPRYRYLELLERHETLRNRLEKAEKDAQMMRRSMLTSKMPEQEAQKILDMWENTLHEALKMQSSWIRAWSSGGGKEEPKEKEPPEKPIDTDQGNADSTEKS